CPDATEILKTLRAEVEAYVQAGIAPATKPPIALTSTKGARFEHGSVLGGKTRAARVNSQWKSTGRVFGYFEEVRRKAFRTDRYTGIFRSARGPSSAFNDIFSFEGPESFPQEFVFVFDLARKTGLHLSPWLC